MRARRPRVDFELLWVAARWSSVADCARELGVSADVVHRWRRNGVPYWRADVLAARVGMAADSVWPFFASIEPAPVTPRR